MLARNFVPRGSLTGTAFNFIFRACVECNQRKANAERHVSTVSLLTSPARAADAHADRAAVRKAESDFHPKVRGTRVKDASTQHEFHGTFGPANISFTMVAPPQLDDSQGALVACNQIQAMFSLITSVDPRTSGKTRLLPASQWKPLGAFPFQDWGNRQLQTVTQRAASWPLLAGVVTANGYFKVLIRRRDEGGGEWFWALEWNKSIRVAGVVFADEQDPPLFDDLPDNEWRRISPTERTRRELPLGPDADSLFSW